MRKRQRLRWWYVLAALMLVLLVGTVGILHGTFGVAPAGPKVKAASSTTLPSDVFTGVQTTFGGLPTPTPTAVATATTAPVAVAPTNTPVPAATPDPNPKPAATPRPYVPPKPKPTPPPYQPPQPLPPASGVAVSGTHLVNGNGQVVRLIGAAYSYFEYSCYISPHMGVGDFQTMRNWGMNVVRFTLSSELWGHTSYCPNYAGQVQQAVANAENAGMYVILTMQWDAPFDTGQDRTSGGTQYPMPDNGQDVRFWQYWSALYGQDKRVLLNPMGEPHDIDCNTWYNGGAITVYATNTGFPPYPVTGTYQATGMKQMVQIMRGAGSHNVIVVGGLTYGYDLSCVTGGYAIPDGDVIYDSHPFDYSNKQPGDWDRAFGNVSYRYAVMSGEFGEYDCATGYISRLIPYFNAHAMSWLAWNWGNGTCNAPSLIADWNGDPLGDYGAYIKQQMLAIYKP